MSTPKAQRQPLSDKHKLIVIITAIVLAAIIAVSVTLIVLLQPKVVTPDNNDPSNNPSSNLPVKNGDFGIINSEDTLYPKSATNWTRYGYKAPNGSSHDFEAIESTENAVMGIVDTEDEQWTKAVEDLAIENVTLGSNPKQHALSDGGKHTNSNIYMIASKKATNAGIMSDSVTVSATTSVKITVWLNTSQLTENGASIMIQNSSSTPNAKEDNRYAYKYSIPQQDGWHAYEFHVFNRKTSTQYIRVSVSLGNIYTDAPAQGTLYIDDISFETVTANDYRLKADLAEEGDTTYKIIEKEEETTVPQESGYLALNNLNNEAVQPDYTTSEQYVNSTKTADNAEGYSPFTDKDDFVNEKFGIYKLSNNGTVHAPVGLQIAEYRNLRLDEDDYTKQDYEHISFWVRTVTKNDNALAFANILVQRQNSSGEWESLSNGDFTAKTEQNIKTDTNNGWSKYDIYLKPDRTNSVVRILFALGSADGYESTEKYAPEGELYVTTPYFETISISAYTSASSSTASKKFDLAGSTAETSVSNGSFSSISANTKQPTSWTPVFAGQNAIYRDGKGDEKIGNLSTDKAAIEGSGVVTWKDEFSSIPDYNYVDDDEGRILKLVNNKNYSSSYGYLSNEITATAHTVYAFSVLAKVDVAQAGAARANPYFYLLETNTDRDKAVVGKVESAYSTTTADGSVFGQADSIYEGTGWVRYYIVYVTGDKDTTIRLALFNGSIDGLRPAGEDATVYYDKVTMQSLGTYAMVEDEDNKDAEEYIDKFTATNEFKNTTIGDCENVKEVLEAVGNVSKEIVTNQPSDEEWTEMKKIPEPDDDDDDDNNNTTPSEERDVNLALLFSILSSVLLVAALAVVVVLKIFKRRKRA